MVKELVDHKMVIGGNEALQLIDDFLRIDESGGDITINAKLGNLTSNETHT
jgi:hypothetical protein